MEKFYIYSTTKNKVIEIKNVEVEARNNYKAIYKIITIDDEVLIEVHKVPLRIYKDIELKESLEI